MSQEFTQEQIAYFRTFLKNNSGYDLGDGKEYLLSSRLKTVLDVHDLNGYDDIINGTRMNPHGTLATDVIEAMTVNETFFFRDDKPFDFFKNEIVPHLTTVSQSRPVKIWSAACSTGQEPYSLAMLLEENKKKTPDFKYDIDASDINNRILAKARQGIYSAMEVGRGLEPAQKNAYFTEGDNAWKINDNIKAHVTFFQQNLREEFKVHKGPYDVIFLRNVLIYFDEDLKKQILRKASDVMRSGGYLILGVAENVYDQTLPLERYQGMTGVYQKT